MEMKTRQDRSTEDEIEGSRIGRAGGNLNAIITSLFNLVASQNLCTVP